MKNISLWISGAQHTLSTIDTKRSTPRYIIIKPLKDKDKQSLKATKKFDSSHAGNKNKKIH